MAIYTKVEYGPTKCPGSPTHLLGKGDLSLVDETLRGILILGCTIVAARCTRGEPRHWVNTSLVSVVTICLCAGIEGVLVASWWEHVWRILEPTPFCGVLLSRSCVLRGVWSNRVLRQ